MTRLRRLVTWVEPDDVSTSGAAGFALRHEAELADGRRVLLLDGRGWTTSGPPDVWSRTSVDDIVATARAVIGPDEPRAGWSSDEEAAAHYGVLAAELERHGVRVDAGALPGLHHDVELSPQLIARLSP